MTADDLASLVVELFNAIEDSPIVFQSSKPDDIAIADKETTDFNVFVVPYGEAEESFDRGDACREEVTVSVVVNGPIKPTITRAKASEFVRFLRYVLRESYLGIPPNDMRWSDNETVSLWDANALRNNGQFLSLFRATYYRFG